MDIEIWYERVTAIRLTQKNDKGDLESRFFPQIERTEYNNDTGEESNDWIIINKEDGSPIFFLEENTALEYAMKYRDRSGKVYL